ncbi:MAG: flavin reductase [Qingshengfaniella sp.]
MTSVNTEHSDPLADPRAYRRCLSQFATGVTVVTAQAGAQRTGVTANSFASLSLDPPLVTWALKRDSRSAEIFKSAPHFAVNILADDQIEISQRFARPGNDKFVEVQWSHGIDGAPLLEHTLATLECDTESVQEGGDHLLIIGRVKKFNVENRVPLLFVQGRYGVAVDHPNLKPLPEGEHAVEVSSDTSLMVLLLYAYQAMSHRFDSRRQLVGMSVVQSRVLAVLHRSGGGLSIGSLATRSYTGPRDAVDAVADLRDRGFVQQSGDIVSLTKQGQDTRESLLRHLRDFDVEQTTVFSDEEVETARRVISHLIRSNSGTN